MNTLHILLTSLGLMLHASTPETAVQLVTLEASEDLVAWQDSRRFFAAGDLEFAAPPNAHFFRMRSDFTMPVNPVVVQVGDSNTGSLAIPWRPAWDAHLKGGAFALFDGDYMARNGELLGSFWARLSGSWHPTGGPDAALNTGRQFDFGPLEPEGSPVWDPWPLVNGTADGRPVSVVIFSLITNDFNHPSRRQSYWTWNEDAEEWEIIAQVDGEPGESRMEVIFRKVIRWLHDDLGCYVILRMPPAYTRYPADGFGVGIPDGIKGDKEVTMINDAQRRAYLKAANDPTLPNVLFFDSWEFVMGWPNGVRPADWDATSDAALIPQMRDNLHYAEGLQAVIAQELNRRLTP